MMFSTCHLIAQTRMLFPSNTQRRSNVVMKQVVINAVHTPPAMIVMHSSEDNFYN